jgi:single-stranded-DNA-specific exonuclease
MTTAQPTITRRPCTEELDLHPNPILNRVFNTRGIQADDAADNRLRDLFKPDDLSGLDKASEIIAHAIQSQRKITVIGDYDTDGATSTTLAITALKAYGAQCVDFLIPNRFDMGYGLGVELVDIAKNRGSELLLTVDNGVSSIAGVAHAKQCGLDVVVTDHHLPGDELPIADAIVNPNLQGDSFPSKNLAGVAVIFYVMNAVSRQLNQSGWFDEQDIDPPNPADWLDLVALGTVADLVPLDRNNRILVEQGLRRMRAGKARPGINALLSIGKRRIETVVASDLGFAVAPRLNAAGRLDDMQRGVDCLQATDSASAHALASELDALNLARRDIESDMHSTALEAVAKLQTELDGDVPPVLCLFEPTWHQGVCGIIASRLKERYHRPALVFASADDGSLRGSARSIPGLHIRDVMASIDAKQPGLMDKFGGHAMAAGLTLEADAFPRFRALMHETVQAHFEKHPPTRQLLTDGPLEADHFSLELAELLRYAAPWGQGFAEPSFDGEFIVHTARVVGERHLKLTLSPLDKPSVLLDAIAFGQADKSGLRQCHAVYRLDINHWRGRDNLQLVVEHLEPR